MFRFELFEGGGVFLFFFYSYYSYPGLRRMGWVLSGSPVQRDNMFFWERVSSISRHPGKPPRKGHSTNKGEKPAFLLAGPPERGPNWCSGYLLFAGRPFISPPGRHRADVICDLSHFRSVFLIAAGGRGRGTRSTLTLAVHGPALDLVGALAIAEDALLCSLPPEEKGRGCDSYESWHY